MSIPGSKLIDRLGVGNAGVIKVRTVSDIRACSGDALHVYRW
jgi:hypothetical protein